MIALSKLVFFFISEATTRSRCTLPCSDIVSLPKTAFYVRAKAALLDSTTTFEHALDRCNSSPVLFSSATVDLKRTLTAERPA